jgi:fatty acid desaturase
VDGKIAGHLGRRPVAARPSVRRWLTGAALDWAYLGAVISVAGMLHHPAVYVVAVLLIGSRQNALAILGHDGAHLLVCRSRRLNDMLARVVCLWPLGISLGAYRTFHFEHHRHLNEEGDPELAHRRAAAPQYDLPVGAGRIWRYFFTDALGLGVRDFNGVGVAIRRSPRDLAGPLLWWSIAAGVAAWVGCLWVIALWFVALPTSFWAVFRFRIWTEHQGTAETHRISANWWQRWFLIPHNTWCHYEHHHQSASVPFWALPQLRPDDAETLSLNELLASYSRMAPLPSGTPPRKDVPQWDESPQVPLDIA